MTGKPRVAVLIGAAWPGNDASGPVQSVRQIAALFADEVHFELFARSGPPGGPELARHRHREPSAWGGTTYLTVGGFGARDLSAAVARAECDRMWLNSVWDREFTLPALILRRFGRGLPGEAIVSTRGEFASGALALHAGRKRVMRRVFAATGLLEGVTLHATAAEEARDVAAAFPGHPMMVAANIRGLPPLPARLPVGDEVLRLLFLGRISPVKGLHNALAAMARLSVPARLTVCGPVHDEVYFAQCRALLSVLPAQVGVDFAGPVTNSESAARYAAADLFLNPSASENFGHTIFEALSAGTPVLTGLATPWNGLEADRAGFNVASDDADAIAAAIGRFAALGPSERAAWQTAARERARRQAADMETLAVWRQFFAGNLSVAEAGIMGHPNESRPR